MSGISSSSSHNNKSDDVFVNEIATDDGSGKIAPSSSSSMVEHHSHSQHPNLVVASAQRVHQLLFTKMRDINTTSAQFVNYSRRSMRLLAEEALAEFPVSAVTIPTQCAPCCQGLQSVATDDPSNICAVSIIRSGDALLEAVRDVEPAIRVGKILIQRDEELPDKPARLFYSKLPPNISQMHVLLCDPMLATGGSAKLALDVLTRPPYDVDATKIIFANMICAPEGLQVLAQSYPQVKIVTVQVDTGLNDDKFIVPGLGDYGDRFFNTSGGGD